MLDIAATHCLCNVPLLCTHRQHVSYWHVMAQ